MKFSEQIVNDPRVKKYNEEYMNHPFIKGLGDGSLDRSRFENYLIQDSLYLKDYGKVYAHIFLLTNAIADLQFLHTCIGVVVSDETNMHTKYLQDYGLDVYKVDHLELKAANRSYLDYMLSFTNEGDVKEIFMAVLPCTLTYEYIGKTLKEQSGNNTKDNYYGPWIEAYASSSFEYFSVRSLEFVDSICQGIKEDEKEKLIKIYLKACEYEMGFWDMSYEKNNIKL